MTHTSWQVCVLMCVRVCTRVCACLCVCMCARVTVSSLCHLRTLDVTLDLEDPQYPEHNLGTLELAVTLSPKEGDFREAVSPLCLSRSLSLSSVA